MHTYQSLAAFLRRLFMGLLLTGCGVGLALDAQAHAVVTASSLSREAVKPHHPTKVVLFFNANVELALSRVFLVSGNDVYQPVEIARGHKPGELHIHLPALEPGSYAIKYKVFAADGHLTESAIRFHVAN